MSRWFSATAPLIAVIALGVGIWALLQPGPAASNGAHFSDQQVGEAKGRVCGAYTMVRTAVSNTMHNAVAVQSNPDVPPAPAQVHAVAADARLAMTGGAAYLLSRLDQATPAPLAQEIRAFADNLQEIVLNGLGGVGADVPVQATRLRESDIQNDRIAELCK